MKQHNSLTNRFKRKRTRHLRSRSSQRRRASRRARHLRHVNPSRQLSTTLLNMRPCRRRHSHHVRPRQGSMVTRSRRLRRNTSRVSTGNHPRRLQSRRGPHPNAIQPRTRTIIRMFMRQRRLRTMRHKGRRRDSSRLSSHRTHSRLRMKGTICNSQTKGKSRHRTQRNNTSRNRNNRMPQHTTITKRGPNIINTTTKSPYCNRRSNCMTRGNDSGNNKYRGHGFEFRLRVCRGDPRGTNGGDEVVQKQTK